jgi:predicted Zn-ribbon and HTH transcriptional regulator
LAETERLEAEIDRLRFELEQARGQNERIKKCWRMCSKCDFVWADAKGQRSKCPQCEWTKQATKLNAAHQALGVLARDLLDQLREVTLPTDK